MGITAVDHSLLVAIVVMLLPAWADAKDARDARGVDDS